MVDTRTGKDLKEFPVLSEPKTYIYIILNDVGKVKIGKTKDIYKRYLSLCGSNGQGNKILRVLCSPGTYLHSLEGTMHNKFNMYRIQNTEWFYDKSDLTGEVLFDNAAGHLKSLFSSAGYKTCNDLRKKMYEDKVTKEKGGDDCDN